MRCTGLQVPVDICVKPEVRSVIITGPNTGGKTAALKVIMFHLWCDIRGYSVFYLCC